MIKCSVKVKNKVQMRTLLEHFQAKKVGGFGDSERVLTPVLANAFMYPTEIFIIPEKNCWDFGQVGEITTFDRFLESEGVEIVKAKKKK